MTKKEKNADDSEEWCFFCKDGGDMIICEHKDCIKSYHEECAGAAAKAKKFICGVHKCNDCRKTPDFQCYVCPNSFCRRCVKDADFVRVKGKKGFCEHCLKLALLVEENKDIDSDGETIDFNNLETYETLFKEYWWIVNAKEKLTLADLRSAKVRLKSENNYDSDNSDEGDEYESSDSEDNEEIEARDSGKKSKNSKRGRPKKNVKQQVKEKSNKPEFIGWGSTRLIEFLKSIGKDTTNALTQRDLELIVGRYAKENNLIQKNKVVECDDRLWSIFKRKTIRMNRIFDSLETHLAENQVVSSDEDDLGYDSEEKDDDNDDDLVIHNNKKKKMADKLVEKKEEVVDISYYRFASIVPENIRLVYLKRSLVQKFENEPETFEYKVIGSFVRVKEDPNGFFSKGYQLIQITGVKQCSVGENRQTFVLQSLETDICINSLSDDDFSEEECQDLKHKVKSGILKKLELVELEEKARSLHRDILANWIPRQLVLLKHRIDQANEKGWRKELHEYLQDRMFLEKPENQAKLLEKLPKVVPDVEESEPLEDDEKDEKESPKSILTHTSSGNFKDIGISSETKQEVPASENFEMAMKLEKFFCSMEKQNKSHKLSAVKTPTQLFDSCDRKLSIDISKEDLEDTKSSQWYVTNSNGDKVGPVSLSVLKNWTQFRVASESQIYRGVQTEEQAKPLLDVLRLAFPTK
uniref:uncharacterized protein At5g08430-like isoform X2 n=1 Tax=Erigeron canadensis TaxID=72917 RepID=UPI001CB9BF8C|nr:uncharacterized protein At5g08430-like isoform X2 [Erigeron canadensis]